MTMVLRVFRHEWAAAWRTGGLLLVILVAWVAGVGSGIVEYRAWQADQSTRTALAAAERAQWLALGDIHFHKAAHRGYFIVRDRPATTILDRGSWDFAGTIVWLESHKPNDPLLRAVDADPLAARGLPRGGGPVLLWLVPLLLVLALHGVVARERQSGSLAFAVSSGARPLDILGGNTLAVAAIGLAAISLPALVAAGLATSGGAAIIDVVLWALSVVLAILAWSAVIVSVSAWLRSPFAALIVLLMVWFAATILVPRSAVDVADTIAPLPASQPLRSEAEAAAEGLVTDATKARVRRALEAERPGVTLNDDGVSAIAAEIDAAAAFRRILTPLYAAMARQSRVFDCAVVLSPTFAADRIGDGLARSDDRAYLAFTQESEQRRLATQMALNRAWAFTMTSEGSPHVWRMVAGAADEARIVDTAPRSAAAWSALAFWIALGAFGVVASARRLARGGA
jgi:ABC-2 type transport system permease protein